MLQGAGLILKTTMVANRGFHNPGAGSFSLFEMPVGFAKPIAKEIQGGGGPKRMYYDVVTPQVEHMSNLLQEIIRQNA
jgi:hypothetical protein